MLCRAVLITCVLWMGAMAVNPAGAQQMIVPSAVVCARNATFAEYLAAKEIHRYVYVRTGQLLPILDTLEANRDAAIVVGVKSQPTILRLLTDAGVKAAAEALGPEQYLLRSIEHQNRPILLVVGGDATGTLFGAYRLAERLGVRFYLHGDVVPDAKIALALSAMDETGKPLFDRRGIQPFHDFPEGPDWWDADAYKAYLGQLSKLRMNFFGLHTYPEGGVGPEPVAWIGRTGEIGTDGRVKASYPARHFTTANGTWGYQAMKTGDYTYGTAALFDRDDYGAEYMRGMTPWPKTPDDQNELFFRMGHLLKDTFAYARRLGIKTCLGTETPLVLPTAVRERLEKEGKKASDPAVIEEVYEGMFRRIAQTHALDYYWFWTPEGWTWEAVSQKQIDATISDFRSAIAAYHRVKPPFTLATCGWVLGPPQQPNLFDRFLPKEMPMSCINRQVGNEPVEPGFAKVQGRPKWAIPWMEDDPGLTSVQLWAGRMRKDAADSLAYGCTGLFGIHWRTRALGPNVAALAAAAWDQSWNPGLNKNIAVPKPVEGPLGGQIAAFSSRMSGTDDQPLYQTVRFNTAGYHLDMPNGAYTVTLKFVEPAYDRAGVRVFGVKLQDNPVIESLDIFAKVGKNKALDYSFKDVAVTDGRLRIDFVYQVEFPCIAAIVVEGPAGARKIHCGGGAYKDYAADWPASTQGGRVRYLPAGDFYADWATAQFGPSVAPAAGAIFARLDCHVPRPADWVDGPGGIRPDPRPWSTVRIDYAFVDEWAALRPQVQGAGNLERFDYWLDTFRYIRAMAQANCDWSRLNDALAKVKAEKDPAAQKKLARELALPIRKEILAAVSELHRHLLATVTTPGEMGTVANWEQHNMPGLVVKPGQELAKLLGEELPADAMPTQQYQGPPRMFVPVVRTGLVAGEPLALTAVVLGVQPAKATLSWRKMARGRRPTPRFPWCIAPAGSIRSRSRRKPPRPTWSISFWSPPPQARRSVSHPPPRT